MPNFFLDRSRLITYQRCPRAYYWNYAYKGLGVNSAKRPLPLAFGGSTHLGLECLLRGNGIEKAVEVALHEFELQARGRGLELQPNEDANSVYQEQRALLEALLRAWFIVRLPSFLEEYEVLDVEREENWELYDGALFLARADGLLRNHSSGDLFILSFKTTKQYGQKTVKEARTDIQGMSELVAVEERLSERVQGIQMEYLVKGRREEWPRSSGIYQTSNPLIRPWIGPNDRLAHSWGWEDLDGQHTLGSKYRKIPIWERLSIREWISMLASGQVQPEAGECLPKWIVSPLPYLRGRDEIESWKTQARQQAKEIKLRSAKTEGAREQEQSDEAFLNALDENFPQHRHSCNYPTQCQFYDLCFGSVGSEPERDGCYVFREPHHEREAVELAE